ncbi:MAG: electron transfer flavoprotein, partial [Gemmatimonadota bacterium]|nr:electron transfer flavoprotein [Gemmatimonadota bacterium]
MQRSIRPADKQPDFPREHFLTNDEPSEENLEVDVLFVGGGPAGLAGAIQLAKLVKADNESGGGLGEVSIGVLEKASALGEHSLSGAVINPAPFRSLFPDVALED